MRRAHFPTKRTLCTRALFLARAQTLKYCLSIFLNARTRCRNLAKKESELAKFSCKVLISICSWCPIKPFSISKKLELTVSNFERIKAKFDMTHFHMAYFWISFVSVPFIKRSLILAVVRVESLMVAGYVAFAFYGIEAFTYAVLAMTFAHPART